MEEIFELLGCHLCVKVIKYLSLIEIINKKNKLKVLLFKGDQVKTVKVIQLT